MPNGHDADDDAYGRESSGSRHSSAEFERDFREHEQSLGSAIGNAGRKLIGKVERVIRNPKNSEHSDEPIREDVRARLAEANEVDQSEIEVDSAAGQLTLTGAVSDRQMKSTAKQVAKDVPGVHHVHNQLHVADATSTESSDKHRH